MYATIIAMAIIPLTICPTVIGGITTPTMVTTAMTGIIAVTADGMIVVMIMMVTVTVVGTGVTGMTGGIPDETVGMATMKGDGGETAAGMMDAMHGGTAGVETLKDGAGVMDAEMMAAR